MIPWKVKKLCLDQTSNSLLRGHHNPRSWILHITPILRTPVYEPPFFVVQKSLCRIHLGARCKVCPSPTSFNTSHPSRYLYLKVCWKKCEVAVYAQLEYEFQQNSGCIHHIEPSLNDAMHISFSSISKIKILQGSCFRISWVFHSVLRVEFLLCTYLQRHWIHILWINLLMYYTSLKKAISGAPS